MALTNLLFDALDHVAGIRRLRIGAIEIDCIVSEQHAGEVEITEHPVEDGSAIADHARPKAMMLTLEGIVTNTPITPEQAQRAGLDGVVGHAAGRYQTVWQQMMALKDAATLLTIVTNLCTYDNMVIQSLTAPRDRTTGDALRFTMQLKQIRIVKNKTAVVVVAAEPKAHAKKKIGKQPTKETSEAVDNRTLAKQIYQDGPAAFKAKLGGLSGLF